MVRILISSVAVLACLGLAVGSPAQSGPSGSGKSGGQQNQSGGQSNGGGPQGSAGTAFIDSQMLAYGAVNELAYAITRSVCTGPMALPDNSTIIIYDQTSFQNLQAWQALNAAVTTLDGEYQTLVGAIPVQAPAGPAPPQGSPSAPPAASPSAAAGGGFFSGSDISGLIGAIAASTSNTASTFTIPDSSMAIALIHQFKRSHCERNHLSLTYYPLLGNASSSDDSNATVIHLFDPLNDKRLKIQKYLAARAAPSQQPAARGQQNPQNQQNQQNQQNTQADPFFTAFTDLNSQYDNILTALTSSINQNQSLSNSSGPIAGITSIVQGSKLEAALAGQSSYILYANIVAAGGIQKDVKNLFTILFSGDLISYSGGVVLNFALIKPDGTIQSATVLRYRVPYTRLHNSHETEDVESPESNDNIFSLCNDEKRASESKTCAVLGSFGN